MKQDAINPPHYKAGKVECIDALESATTHKQGIEAVCVANVIKYLWRYEAKGGVQDVKKAKWYLERLICHLETKEKSKDSSGGVKKLNKQQAAGFCDDFGGFQAGGAGIYLGDNEQAHRAESTKRAQKANAKN